MSSPFFDGEQICIGTFVLMAFQQDELEIANEKQAKVDLIQKMKDEKKAQSGSGTAEKASSEKKDE